MNRTVLYVSGFSSNLRAKDLAWEFERYGRLIRCDIPAPKGPSASAFAFIEFRYERDAEDAYYDMHGRSIDGRRIAVQWAKRPPSAAWRHDGFSDPDKREQDRRQSPAAPAPRRRSPTPPRRDEREEERDRRRSASPRRDADRNGHSSRRVQSPEPSKPQAETEDVVAGDRRDRDAGEA